MMPTTKIVYFAYLVPDKWRPIIEEQLTALVNCGLYDRADEIQMSIIFDNMVDYQELCYILDTSWPKVKIQYVTDKNSYEYLGILNVHTLAHESTPDTVILYFHSKGMTSNLPKIRHSLFQYTIQNYQEYLDTFEQDRTLDIAGYLPHPDGFVYFNFFWIRSGYIQNWCPEPKESRNRFIWEVWFGQEYSTKPTKINTWSPLLGYDQIDKTMDSAIWQTIFAEIHD
jgi:hypothetical protein